MPRTDRLEVIAVSVCVLVGVSYDKKCSPLLACYPLKKNYQC
jgi:hypothetical protein